MVTKEQVLEKLKGITDPEIGIDLVSLGLVYDVKIEGENADVVTIKMTLTTMGCPLANIILGQVKAAVEGLEGVREAKIYLTYDPPWNPDMMSDEAKEKLKYYL